MELFKILAVFFFLREIFNPAYAYIDPGFGSMLVSCLIGVVTTVYFLFSGFVFFLKRKIGRIKSNNKVEKLKNDKNRHPFVIYSDGAEYFNVFKPVIEEFEKREVPLLFLTSSKNDPCFCEDYKFTKTKYIGKNNEAYINLAFLHADICLMTTPQLDVLQLKRSKFVKYYVHIFHGITTSMDYRLFSLDYYDGVLCDGEFQIPLIRELEEKRNLKKKDLTVIGSTYMDVLAQKLSQIKEKKKQSDRFCILIAPSWGENSIFNKYGEVIDKLVEESKAKSFDIIIRPHPRSKVIEKRLIERFREKYKDFENVIWDFEIENLNSMLKSDILLTDYSTVMFDYAFLFEKPFLCMNLEMNREILDISDIEKPIWRYEIMDKIGKQIKRKDIKNIVSIVEEFKNNNNLRANIKEEIKKASETAWFYKGESAERAVDFLLEKQKELSAGAEDV